MLVALLTLVVRRRSDECPLPLLTGHITFPLAVRRTAAAATATGLGTPPRLRTEHGKKDSARMSADYSAVLRGGCAAGGADGRMESAEERDDSESKCRRWAYQKRQTTTTPLKAGD